MRRAIEWLLGLDGGFLSRDGDASLSFDPRWPLGGYASGFTWNVLLLALCGAVVWFVYLRDPATRRERWPMAALRAAVLALVVLLLNRPQLTVTQARVEPSVLAVMIDASLSMRLADVAVAPNQPPSSRLAAVGRLLGDADGRLLRELSAVHRLRFFRFSNDAVPLEAPDAVDTPERASAVARSIGAIVPAGARTRIVESVESVARELRGQRVAGAVLLTDGRETDGRGNEASAALRDAGVKLFPVPVGTDAGLRNVELEGVAVQDSVFAGDIVNVRVTLRTAGVPAGTSVRLALKDKGGTPILDDGKPVVVDVPIAADGVRQAELQFVPAQVGTLDVAVEATPLEGEIDDADNARLVQLAVLDANLRVLYVDGYPRWEYRYLKQELIRDPSIVVSCLLTSADASYAQDGDRPITRFPETLEELLEYDVVLVGDVDPRQFTDGQLQLVNEFVSRRGGGFGMVAGPTYAPQRYQNTAIEPLLPVDVSRVDAEARRGATLAEGFRVALTEDGREGSIFRFFRDPKVNADYVAGRIQELFWYCRGVTAKAGVGVTLAQHPTETGPDGRPAPLVVTGRFGTGRTAFMGIDDTWRWRYYTGESIFDSYWTQTLRTLARGKKLGQRKLTLASERPVYQLGESARVNVRVLDPQLLTTLPDELRAQLVDEQGQPVSDVALVRRGGAGGDAFAGGFTAERLGRFTVRLPSLGGGVDEATVPLEVAVPRLELNDPTVDRAGLARLAAETGGAVVPFADAASLPTVIPSAQRDIPLITSSPLWAAPLALALFAGLITAEWVLRKRAGMV